MTVRVYSSHCARADFIEYQKRSLERFLLTDYRLIILNDAKEDEVRESINEECKRLSIDCIETPDDLIHSSGPVACASVMQWVWDTMGHMHNDIVMFLDSDMFMIKEFCPKDFLGDSIMAGVRQDRGGITYLWNGIMIFDVPQMPNPDRMMLYCGIVRGNNVDVGGLLYYYFLENPEVNVKMIPHTSHIHSDNSNLDSLPKVALEKYDEDYRIEICASTFLHYGSGTNWKVLAGNRSKFVLAGDSTPPKTKFVFWLLEECISGRIDMPEILHVYGA